jgi:REP element-mobilizing transposase RayT
MNKRLRIEYAGAVYHVIQRGNNKEFVFHQAQDKGYFLKSVEKVMRFCEADTFAYVIMGNHYHLLVRTGEIGLGQVMHRLNTRYSMYYNQIKNRSGHVFQGRYQAGLIQDERHLLTVLRYIHQNPLRAGFVTGSANTVGVVITVIATCNRALSTRSLSWIYWLLTKVRPAMSICT